NRMQRGTPVFRMRSLPGQHTARTPRGLIATTCLAATAALTVGVLSAVPTAHAAPPPPRNPSDSQISSAQRAKNDAAATVGRLSAQISQAKAELLRLSAKAQLAEQKYALAVQKLNDAQAAEAKAKAAVAAAQKQLDKTRANLRDYVRNSYLSPQIESGPGGLLTADNPNDLLQR